MTAKTTKKDFEFFKQSFIEYQKRFGLTGYEMYFLHEFVRDCHADISVDQMSKKGTVRLSTSWAGSIRPINEDEIKRTALHEALHLVVNRLVWLATCRYIGDCDLKEEDEAVTIRLVGVIRDYEKEMGKKGRN